MTPASPLANAKLTNSTEKEEEENAELTGSTGRLPIKGQPQYGRLSTNDQSDGDEEAENDRLFEEWYRRQRDSEPTGTLIIEGSSDDDYESSEYKNGPTTFLKNRKTEKLFVYLFKISAKNLFIPFLCAKKLYFLELFY